MFFLWGSRKYKKFKTNNFIFGKWRKKDLLSKTNTFAKTQFSYFSADRRLFFLRLPLQTKPLKVSIKNYVSFKNQLLFSLKEFISPVGSRFYSYKNHKLYVRKRQASLQSIIMWKENVKNVPYVCILKKKLYYLNTLLKCNIREWLVKRKFILNYLKFLLKFFF